MAALERFGPVVDFDQHSPAYAADWEGIVGALRSDSPVAWTDAHGGFWVVTSYEHCNAVLSDPATYSSDHDMDGTRNGYQGVVIPTFPVHSIPVETDPPVWNGYRKILSPKFSPSASAAWEPVAVEWTTALIDDVIESGHGDLILDIASPLPAIVTLAMMGMPVAQWRQFADPFHYIVGSQPGSPEYARAQEGMMQCVAQFDRAVQDRLSEPQDDFITYLAHAEVDGERLAPEVASNILMNTMAGGADTTTSLLGHAFKWLHDHPEDKARLIEEPELVRLACEEFLRYFSPVQGEARTATRDVELAEARIRAGDRIYVVFAGANRDSTAFADPTTLRLDRAPNPHFAFGKGIHRCVGAHQARVEFVAVIGQVLERMPDYRLDEATTVRYATIGQVNGYMSMPATFTPGVRRGAGVKA